MSSHRDEQREIVKQLIQELMPDMYPQSFADGLVDEFWDVICDEAEGRSTGNPELDALLVSLGGRVDGEKRTR